ncbi:hypothetical protein BDD12DRAFT_898128 [Trichophaea hybrida]|nr:hypothetical protein BDD12DRAFT_898128 [Trichophaea hybrida]
MPATLPRSLAFSLPHPCRQTHLLCPPTLLPWRFDPRCLLQFEQAAPLIAVVEVKRGDDRYRDLSAASFTSPVVLIEHTQLRQEPDPDMQTYLRTCEQPPRFPLHRAKIPRTYVDEPGCMSISAIVSRRYSTEVEEDRVALGSALGEPSIQTEPEPFRRKKAMQWTADGRETNLAGEGSKRTRKKREDKIEAQI